MKLNYKKLGEGNPLVILHGLFGSLDNWMSLAKKLSESREVWLVDQRNHGQSEHSPEHTYTAMADDLATFLAEHKIERPTLLGHSMGGKTVMEFAMQHSALIDKLIVVDIAPTKYKVHHQQIIDGLLSIDLQTIESRKEAEQILAQTINEFGVRQFLLKNLYWKEKENLAWRFNLKVLADSILPISEWNISKGESNVLTLFIKGSKSKYIEEEHLERIEKKFPKYKLLTIENAGHWVHAEAPAEFLKAVDSFMKD